VKRGFVLLFAMVVAFSWFGTAFAQTYLAQAAQPCAGEAAGPAKEAPMKPEKPKAKRTRGEVVSVDPATSTLVVKAKPKKGEAKEMTFSVAEKAAKGLADLKAGDKVNVTYMEEDGKLIAKSVRKAPAKPKAMKEKHQEMMKEMEKSEEKHGM
jgi:Cu/Ag efflux protein CusF